MSSWVAFFAGIIALIGIYSMLSLALNLQFGYAGLINFGIVAFFAVGAYTYSIITVAPPGPGADYIIGLGWPKLVGLIAAGVVTVVFAFLIGLPTLRLSGEYLALVTFAFAEVVKSIITNEKWLTNGVGGFTRQAQPFRDYFGSGQSYEVFFALLVLAALALVYFLIERICQAPFGRMLKSLRENEEVAISIGKNIYGIKMKSFLLGALVAGVAGAFYVWYATLVVPDMFEADVTFIAWIALIIGGAGNNRGAIIGTLVLIMTQEMSRFFQASADMAEVLAAFRYIVIGLMLVLVLRFRPNGIFPEKKVISGYSPEELKGMEAMACSKLKE